MVAWYRTDLRATKFPDWAAPMCPPTRLVLLRCCSQCCILSKYTGTQCAHGTFWDQTCVAAAVRSFCAPACSFALVILILLSGFALKPQDIHPWWIWMYWASPITVSNGVEAWCMDCRGGRGLHTA